MSLVSTIKDLLSSGRASRGAALLLFKRRVPFVLGTKRRENARTYVWSAVFRYNNGLFLFFFFFSAISLGNVALMLGAKTRGGNHRGALPTNVSITL